MVSLPLAGIRVAGSRRGAAKHGVRFEGTFAAKGYTLGGAQRDCFGDGGWWERIQAYTYMCTYKSIIYAYDKCVKLKDM